MSRASFTLNSQSIRDPHLQYCCLVALQWMGGMKLCAVAPSSPQLGPFLKMFEFWKILMWGFIVEKRCIWNVRKCDKTQTFQNIIMPPKSDYWKYFLVQGVLAVCQISVEIDNWPPTVITQLLGFLNLLRMNLKMMK